MEASDFDGQLTDRSDVPVEDADVRNALMINCLIADTRLHHMASAISEYSKTADISDGVAEAQLNHAFSCRFDKN
jgi:hypothetical protein